MRALLVLGCEGRRNEQIIFCNGVENIILDLEKLVVKSKYIDLIKYLDSTPKLFYAPCCSSNIITNTIYKIHEMGFIDDKFYEKIGYFYKMHLFCGMVLRIRPKADL